MCADLYVRVSGLARRSESTPQAVPCAGALQRGTTGVQGHVFCGTCLLVKVSCGATVCVLGGGGAGGESAVLWVRVECISHCSTGLSDCFFLTTCPRFCDDCINVKLPTVILQCQWWCPSPASYVCMLF